jgi:hypothetical protein
MPEGEGSSIAMVSMPTGSTGTGDVAPFFALPHFRQNLLPTGSSAEQERQRGMGYLPVSISQHRNDRITA